MSTESRCEHCGSVRRALWPNDIVRCGYCGKRLSAGAPLTEGGAA